MNVTIYALLNLSVRLWICHVEYLVQLTSGIFRQEDTEHNQLYTVYNIIYRMYNIQARTIITRKSYLDYFRNSIKHAA